MYISLLDGRVIRWGGSMNNTVWSGVDIEDLIVIYDMIFITFDKCHLHRLNKPPLTVFSYPATSILCPTPPLDWLIVYVQINNIQFPIPMRYRQGSQPKLVACCT